MTPDHPNWEIKYRTLKKIKQEEITGHKIIN